VSMVLGLSMIGGWLVWSATWAFALRVGLSLLAARLFPALPGSVRAFSVYGTMVAILIGSLFLHLVVLGAPNMYGATPPQAFSLTAYFLAPFGFPLWIGGLMVLLSDAALGPFELKSRPLRRSTR
jgi:hypothetical protein